MKEERGDIAWEMAHGDYCSAVCMVHINKRAENSNCAHTYYILPHR